MADNPDQAESNDNSGSRLEKLTAHLQALITSLEDIVFEVDGNLRFKNVWVSDESMLFMPKEQFLGKKVSDVMGPQAAMFTEPLHKVIQTGTSQDFVYRHPDGSVNEWFRARVKPVVTSPDLEKYTLILSIQNITKQKLAEIDLQEVKERLEFTNQLLDVSQELNRTTGWEYDLQTREIFWTRQAFILFDVPGDFDLSYHNTLQFFDKEDWESMIHTLDYSIQTKVAENLEMRVITASGMKKWVRVIGVPVMNGEQVVKLRGALIDITLKKETEEQLLQAKKTAEEALKEKSDFLSMMSHEIRTPLNGIIGIANLLKLEHTESQKEYVDSLIYSADHLLSLINDILDLNKIENQKLDLMLTEVNLAALAGNTKNLFGQVAEMKGIALECRIAEDVPFHLLADPIRLGQILNNLISNAIKFTDAGEVVLEIKPVSVDHQSAVIQFTVKDTGIGIPEHLHSDIFESFKQVQQSPQRSHTGTGLGLSITQKLLHLHNSSISLKSEPGKGTAFEFEIKFKIPSSGSALDELPAQSVRESAGKLTGLEVLIVEDNPINMLVAKKQLEHFGINPQGAADGYQALEILNQNPFHVALVDLHMPGMDGYALSEKIQQLHPETHIIILTADILSEVTSKLASMNITDILSKPFAPEHMYKALHQVAVRKNLNQ